MDGLRTGPGTARGAAAAESDALILVDEADRELGHLSKSECHQGRGVLHRAFSLLIFNPKGELLLQQRAASKPLWPLYWSNSCCSHPRRNESMDTAIHRRLDEELGIRCPLQFLYKFQYHAQFGAAGAEHELCSVYAGRHGGRLRVNRDEIANWRWVGQEELAREMSGEAAARFTPWFILEWTRICRDHQDAVVALEGA